MPAHRVVVAADQLVLAPPQALWDTVTDWPRQGEWMVGTAVTSDGAPRVGQRIDAFSGRRPVGFLDQMTVTEWDPPQRCVVDHHGRLLRGIGVIEVVPLPAGQCRLLWREELDLPYGIAGRLVWSLVRPGFVLGVKLSLRRLARLVQDRAG